jgi:Na+/glutamate symporter
MCALLASSGTTPPYCSCIFCVAIILLNIFPSLHTAEAVSSQEDSIASMVIDFFIRVDFSYELRVCKIQN